MNGSSFRKEQGGMWSRSLLIQPTLKPSATVQGERPAFATFPLLFSPTPVKRNKKRPFHPLHAR